MENHTIYADVLVGYNLVLYVPLIVASFWYYWTRIMQLNEKRFHLMMLTLSVSSYLMQVAVICAECAYYNQKDKL
jgi:hypothetical protein